MKKPRHRRVGNNGVFYAVALTDNTDPETGDQLTDAGSDYSQALDAARLYASTSRYRSVVVLECHAVLFEIVKDRGDTPDKHKVPAYEAGEKAQALREAKLRGSH